MPYHAGVAVPQIDLERDVDEAIRQAGGARAAVRGLILGQRQIVEQIGAAVSTGYVRGMIR